MISYSEHCYYVMLLQNYTPDELLNIILTSLDWFCFSDLFLARLFTHPSGDQWVQVNKKPVEDNHYRVKDLQVGDKMLFRVVAVNIAGRSPPATLAQAVTIKELLGQICVLSLLSLFYFFITEIQQM